MLPWVCSVVDHRRLQNVVKKPVTHEVHVSNLILASSVT